MKSKKVISSKNNPQLKNIRQLLNISKRRKEQGLYVVEGIKMIEEAMGANLLEKVYSSETFYEEKKKEDSSYFNSLDLEVLTDSVFNSVSNTKTPQGIMGIVRSRKYDIEHIVKQDEALLLILEDIRDPGNLGTMIRTAEGAGATGVIMNNSCVDLYNPKVVRSTMGSIFRVPIYIAEDFNNVLKVVEKNNITIYGADLAGTTYDDEIFDERCAIVIGNEAKGISQGTSNAVKKRVKIPMKGKVESLNAAIAAAILMYEVSRQKRI